MEEGEFWHSPDVLQRWRDQDDHDGIVDFSATLVAPRGEGEDSDEPEQPPEGWPIAFYFSGLGHTPQQILKMGWAEHAPEPYVLVTAARPEHHWWFIRYQSETWGWIDGSFQPRLVALFDRWMTALVDRPGIDSNRVGLFGFSAGAYAAIELLSAGATPISGLGLGGVHAHGQADMDELPAKKREGAGQKFAATLARLRGHRGAPWIEATHVKQDRQCSIGDARHILDTLSGRQEELGLPPVALRLISPEEMDSRPGSRSNKSFHNYLKASFMRREFFVTLFGGEAPDLPADEPSETPFTPLAPHLPSRAPPSTLDVPEFSVDLSEDGWEERAFDIFSRAGFVVIESALKLHQCMQVLRDCDRAAKEMTHNEPGGNRGSGRYSFGKASFTGSMLHVPSFAKHLLEAAAGGLRPLLDRLFLPASAAGDEDGDATPPQPEGPGFQCYSGGGDFVVGGEVDFQPLHSDIQMARAQDVHLPPPLLSVNFCVQPLTNDNGAMRIVPGERDASAVPNPEPGDWRRSRLCPLPLGAAIVRDVRTLHGGTPNYTAETRFLPSIEFVSAAFRATNRGDKFPPPRCLPQKLHDRLPPDVQELCEELVMREGSKLQVGFRKQSNWKR